MTIHAWSHVEWSAYGEEAQREDGYDTSLPKMDRPLVGHRAALKEFVSAIRENRHPEADAPCVINAQEIVEAFYRFTDGSPSPDAGHSL